MPGFAISGGKYVGPFDVPGTQCGSSAVPLLTL